MELNQKTITAGAYAFANILSLILIKYVLYDNGFAFANILLIAGIIYVRLFLLNEETHHFQEGAALILFILFDKNLLDIGNVLLLLGVACVREQFHKDLMYKETISFACGLTFLLMGWYSAGRILIIYALVLFYYYTILMISSVFLIFTLFDNFMVYLGNLASQKKKPEEIN